jgi:DNA repair protein RadC
MRALHCPCVERCNLRTRPVEVFGVLLLDARLTLLDGFLPVAGGALMHCSVKPREVFAEAVARRAAGVVLAHNHPGGDPLPSPEDHQFTKTMLDAARLLGIRVLDHMIVTRRAYFSFSEARLL